MLLLSLLACAHDPATSDTDVETVDVALTEADLPTPTADEAIWWGPEAYVEPYSEVMWCVFGTYTGPDEGIHEYVTYGGEGNHHVVVLGTTTPAKDYPDGTVVDCTKTQDLPMTDLEPVFLPARNEDGTVAPTLPDGMAAKLHSGQRYVIQTHYLNTTPNRLHIKDAVLLGFLEPDTVQTWAAPLVLNSSAFSIPAQQDYSRTFDCTIDQPVDVLYLLGHMHEWGTAISIDRVDGAEPVNLYAIPDWDPSYRDVPPVNSYDAGELSLPAGATLRTTCSWHNDTDAALEFPQEMCVGVGMVYPLTAAMICDDDGT